jgi:N-acetylmuramoyl-L-alanine amidase
LSVDVFVIYEPIKYGYAFTPVTDGRINQPASAEAKMAVEEALLHLHDLV